MTTPSPATTLPFHEYAEIFPMLKKPAMKRLTSDIASHGLMQPIVIYEGKILDGRNRWNACEMSRTEVRTVRFEDITPPGTDALDWVMSTNLQRRHLTTSQRAMAGHRYEEIWAARAKERQKYAAERTNELRWGDESVGVGINAKSDTSKNRGQPDAVHARDEAAKMADVSSRTLHNARVVRRDGVEGLASAVVDGIVPVTTAAQIAKLPTQEQTVIMEKVDAAPTEKEARAVVRDHLKVHSTPKPTAPPVLTISERPDGGDVYIARVLAEGLLELLEATTATHPNHTEALMLLEATLMHQPAALKEVT